jgi:hypothetical protein
VRSRSASAKPQHNKKQIRVTAQRSYVARGCASPVVSALVRKKKLQKTKPKKIKNSLQKKRPNRSRKPDDYLKSTSHQNTNEYCLLKVKIFPLFFYL